MKYREKLQAIQKRPDGCSCSEDALRAFKMSIWCNYCPSSRHSDRDWYKNGFFNGVDTEERIGELDDLEGRS